MDDRKIRAALPDATGPASDANDFETGAPDLSRGRGARISAIGRAHKRAAKHSIVSRRAAEPETLHGAAGHRRRRLSGSPNIANTTYDGRPSYTVSIMEFLDGKVARETQYFADPVEPGPSRAQWVERKPPINGLLTRSAGDSDGNRMVLTRQMTRTHTMTASCSCGAVELKALGSPIADRCLLLRRLPDRSRSRSRKLCRMPPRRTRSRWRHRLHPLSKRPHRSFQGRRIAEAL